MMNGQHFQQLNIVLIEYDKVWCYCTFHKDTIRPNLSISLLDKYYGIYKCWACGINGRLSKSQMDKLSLSHIVHKNNRKILQTRWKEFNESCHDNLQKFPLLKLGLAKELNVSTKSLDDWLVGYDGESFTIPMFREDLIEYHSQRGTCGIQRRFADGTKRSITGSHLGLMYPYERIGDDYYIFICEGFSDGVSVWDLGLQSVSRPHCHYIDGIEGFFDAVSGDIEKIIIIPDNDTVGHKGAERVLDTLKWEYDCSIFTFSGAKDIRELIRLRGKDCIKKALLGCI